MGYEKNITCTKCGAIYELYKTTLNSKDDDFETCEVCGEVLLSWKGSYMYSIKLIKKIPTAIHLRKKWHPAIKE